MCVLFYCRGDEDQQTLNAFRDALPEQTIVQWPAKINPSDVTAAIVWQPPADFFNDLTNLNTIYSLSAGVDHLLNHPGLPDNVAIVRLTDAGMAQPMSEYVLYGVLHAQRQMTALANAQRNQTWRHDITPSAAKQFRVGILGAGELGQVAAECLLKNNFAVSSWSRTSKSLTGIKHYAGEQGLNDMLPTVQALVCLLPLTENTTGIINASLLAKLPKNAFIINPGRGDHLDEQALLNALDNDHISGALLDVFTQEPLPNAHPFWSHPKIIVTPHVAAATSTPEAIEQVKESMDAIKRGENPRGLVNRKLGY